VKYHGLARRHLMASGFLMRPLLNGGTLGGRKPMLGCTCVDLPETFYLDRAPVGWSDHLHEIATGSWKTLRLCSVCNAAFAVDVWDKLQEQVVVRIADRTQWEERADSVPVRKSLLLQSRGGLEGGTCICLGCSNPRVRGVVYCLDHLWETGARR